MSDTPEYERLLKAYGVETGAVPVQHPEPVPTPSQETFLAQSRKAVAGGVVAATTAVAGAITSALTDGAVSAADVWLMIGALVGGFGVGFGGVWVAPANAAKV